MSVWTARPRSTPRHGEANINVHVLCHRDFIRCFLCNCISRTTVMKMPQRANEMNCETSPSRRRWPPPPPGRGDPAPAPSKVLGDLLGINNRLFARVPPCLPLTLTSGRAQSWASSRSPHVQRWETEGLAAPVLQRGSHPSSETQGEAVKWGERMKKSPVSWLPDIQVLCSL